MNAFGLKNVYFVIACFLLQLKRVESQSRIIGGELAHNVPFVASIISDTIFGRFHSCGGSIINERTVLTAAHCLSLASASLLEVHVGEMSRELIDGQVYPVEAIYYHEKWTSATQDYDVGLVRINGTFSYGPTVQPIKLASRKFKLKDGTYATVYGWGFTDVKKRKVADYLMMAKIPIVRRGACSRQMKSLITPRMLCAGFKMGGVDACQMDSGGPLVAKTKQIGIVSWGVGCAQPNKPGVYARVSELLPWIENILFTEYNEVL